MALENTYAEVLSTSVVEGFYDEVNNRYADVLRNLLPTGAAWTFEDDSEMYKFLRALSYPFLRVAQRAQRIFEEMDPRTTTELLEDWERVLDLPGSNPTPATTISDRREAIHALLLGWGNPTPAFFITTAATVGYTVLIEDKEYDAFVAGSSVGDSLRNGGWAFLWKVITLTGSKDESLEWIIDLLVPAHTYVIYGYIGESYVEQENPKAFDLRAIASNGSDMWCAVGQADGVDSYIVTSGDGYLWTERAPTVAKNINLLGIHYADSLWCAVGVADGADGYILTSSDGITWTERVGGTKNESLNGVSHNGSNLWCAVGTDDGVDAYILTSADAITWTERSNPKNFTLRSVAYDGSALWVAVGAADGADAYIITSPDGTTWTERSNAKNFTLMSVKHNGTMWVAVGVADGADAYIVTSTDGITWTERSNPKNFGLNEVVWIDLGDGYWYAFGDSDGVDSYAVKSTDGITWTEVTVGNGANKLNSADYYDGMLVVVGADDGTDAEIHTSPFGF